MPPRFRCLPSGDDSSLNELDFQRDGHFVADENAAGLKRRIPGQAVVFAVDLCSRGDSNPCIAPGIFRRWSRPFHVKDHLTSDATNGQITLDREFSVADQTNARGFERQCRELLYMEEIGTLEVRI